MSFIMPQLTVISRVPLLYYVF